MSDRTRVAETTTTAAQQPATTASVTSSDGSVIAYRQLGHGPGLVILHGAMESSQSHMQLAEVLADSFTVYLPDRRDRGLSVSADEPYSMRKEVEDLDALLTQTGAHAVMGVSAGALIALQAALSLPAIHKLVLFEPPLSVNGSAPTKWVPQLQREVAEGRLDDAMVTGMLGAQMGPAFLQKLPRWLLRSLTRRMMANEQKQAAPSAITMRMLAPTLGDDGQLVAEMSETLERFRSLPTETLLLGGSKSPAYLRIAVDALERTLPHARRIEYPGLDHGATGPTDRGGKP